ncbi:MAG: hypothetical protein H0U66_17390 [Gemmatimonadaceae bacterium]|nr:hypothetical protein [Gemmatimonadaceae bacterium]
MITRAWLVAGTLVVAAASGGCNHHSRSAAAQPTSRDSLVGIVSVTGTSFEQYIVLRTSSGIRALALSSTADSAALATLGGVEVKAYGTAHADRFELSAFSVKSVDGAAVIDGVLMRDGSHYSLRTRGGDVALGNPPAALEKLVGARLWVGGPLDSGPNVYGVITR